ncbi:MAG: helix-turn-helix domain-containing protein [Holosporaceae bacterium]|nr:helix-turn-helix domain-containing protein [Holosporaceae bacterium]
MIDFKIIGRRIQRYRKQGGLSQGDVAEKLDVSISYISQIERGVAEVSLKRLDEIAGIVNTKIELLVADTDITSTDFLNSEIYNLIKGWNTEKKELLVNIINAIEHSRM